MTTRLTSVRAVLLAAGMAGVVGLTACGGGFSAPSGASASQQSGKAALNVLMASGGPADLNAVKAAAASWAQKSGNTITVNPASDMAQQLSQGFAAASPPDVFMVDASQVINYASAGDLFAYGDSVPYKNDLYPGLRQTFTYQGKLQCVPKDSSTLGLVINTDLWKSAGLTAADVPTSWAQLEAVAKKLTTGGVTGLSIGDTRDRIGAFMVQAGGWFTNADQTQMTADTPANLQALQFVKKLLTEGVAKYPKQLGSGWSGEALGKGKAAMVIEGNWFTGAAQKDYPNLNYKVYELPAGPKGKGTLSFTQCWGVAAQSKYHQQSVDFINSLMNDKQQVTFAKAFGVMPSLQSATAQYQADFPNDAAWIAGTKYAQGPVNAKGLDAVMKDFDTQIQALATTDPAAILTKIQAEGQAAINANK